MLSTKGCMYAIAWSFFDGTGWPVCSCRACARSSMNRFFSRMFLRSMDINTLSAIFLVGMSPM